MPRILFVLTSANQVGPNRRPTGYEFSEVANPYRELAQRGIAVDFASVAGGEPPIDGYDETDAASREFRQGEGFPQLNQSRKAADVDFPAYDAIFFPGGLGPMVDLAVDSRVKAKVAEAYEAGRVIAAVCHGPVALLNVVLSDGSKLLSGKRATSFTRAEEVGYSIDDVPFLLDEALRAEGVQFSNAEPFASHVVSDGRLITGQNPASAAGVGIAIAEQLRKVESSRILTVAISS